MRVLLAGVAAALGSLGAPAVAAAAPPTTPIGHVVVIFGENVSFDHYFGSYPSALNPPGEPAFTPVAGTPTPNGLSGTLLTANPNGVNPTRLPRSPSVTCDNNHSYTAEQQAYDGGLMDRFVAFVSCGGGGTTGMGYYDGNSVTALWNYAQNYVMTDAYYGTQFGPSTPGALNLISGNTHPPGAPANGAITGDPDPVGDQCGSSRAPGAATFGAATNIGTLLSAQNVTWGWFQGGFRPTGSDGGGAVCASAHANVGGSMVTDYSAHHEPFQYYDATRNPAHVAPASVPAIGHDDAGGVNHQYDLTDYFAALDAGTPPAVSFLKAPAYQDGHAGNSDPLDEQRFVVDAVNRIQASNTWADTAIVITYDDSDGWYDHQAGPIVNSSTDPADALNGAGQCGPVAPAAGGYQRRCGYGPRLPLLVVSPWSRINQISHTVRDQTSILRFIEDDFGTGRIGDSSFDDIPGGKASISGLFDFTAPHGGTLRLDPETGNPPAVVPPAPVPPAPVPPATPGTGTTSQTAPSPPVRVRATRLTATARPRRDRAAPFTYILTGQLQRPVGVTAAHGCSGTVTVRVRAGIRTLITRKVKLAATCRWRVKLRFATVHSVGGGHLKVTASFGGNAALLPRGSATIALRAG